MRKIGAVLSFLTVAFYFNALYAQNGPDSLHPQQKVYMDKEHKTLFWPINKPVWVRISETPDENAPSFLLREENDLSNIPRGIKLDVSGTQSLRWYNQVTRDTMRFKFTSDGEQPKCFLKMNGSRPFINQGKTIYGTGVTCLITARDRLSGVDKIMVSIDNAAYQPISGPISFDKEKEYKVSFYAVDHVGNQAIPYSTSFSIDKSAPVTSVASNGKTAESAAILSTKSNLSLFARDSVSGVKEIRYSFDDKTRFSTYESPLSLSDFKDGKHKFSFYSVDNTGNQESTRFVEFTIDNTAPVPSVSFEGDHSFENGIDVISQRTKVSMHANDDKSGIDKIEYTIGNGKMETYSSPFAMPALLSGNSLEIRASDKAGNFCPLKAVALKLDSKAPQSKFTINGKSFRRDNTVFILPQTKISFSAEDDISGVKTIGYNIQGRPDTVNSASFSAAEEGKYILNFWSLDSVNNKETPQSVAFVVDKTPPKIIETFSVNADTSSKVMKLPAGSSLYLAAGDNASGVESIWYSINGKKEQKYNGALQFDAKGKCLVKISARDNLGLTTEKALSFEVIE